MKKTIEIHNFGPLKEAHLKPGLANLIIGLQSSGKSCVMMMACYCSWVEKRISIRQGGFVYVDKTGLVYRLAQDGKGENILIEEYNRNILKGFYSAFKAADQDLRFVLLTGVTKFSQAKCILSILPQSLRRFEDKPDASAIRKHS